MVALPSRAILIFGGLDREAAGVVIDPKTSETICTIEANIY